MRPPRDPGLRLSLGDSWNPFGSRGWTCGTRTAGYTCTAAAHVMVAGLIDEVGVIPPEALGRVGECFAFVMDYLGDRGIVLKRSVEGIS